MSLRAVPARLFLIRCDTCGVETTGQTMPVEAELRAAESGWKASPGRTTHVCPWCVEKGRGDFLPAAAVPSNTSPTAGR